MGAVAAGAVGRRLGGIDVGQQFADAGLKAGAGVLVGGAQGRPIALRPFAGGAQDETGHRVEFVGDGAQAQPPGLKRDAAAAGGYVEDDGVGNGHPGVEPVPLVGRRVVRKGAGMALIADLVALVIFFGDGQPLGDVMEVGAGAEEVENGGAGSSAVGRLRQQRQQSGGPGGRQRPPRPPDVEPVDRRQGRGGGPLADGLGGEFVDGEPFFDEAGCGGEGGVGSGGGH